MASDLEKFLQQAAERLAQKVHQGTGGQAAPTPPRPASVRASERSRQHLDPEVVDAEIVIVPGSISQSREAGPNPLSTIDTRPGLAQEINFADERMAGHLHEVFDHDVMHLRQASAALSQSPQGETQKSTNLQRREQDISPLIKMLRQPSTLRAAFLASEIFKTKF